MIPEMNRNVIIFALMTIILLSGCKPDKSDMKYLFIGDSIVEGWDTERFFPDLTAGNAGVSGSGIAYIEESRGKASGCVAVVLTGTNDLQHLTDDSIPGYCRRYVDALEGLGAERLYAITILPRNIISNIPDCDNRIKLINGLIHDEIAGRDNIKATQVEAFSAMSDGHGGLRAHLTADGLHLNDSGYRILAGVLRKHIRLSELQ